MSGSRPFAKNANGRTLDSRMPFDTLVNSVAQGPTLPDALDLMGVVVDDRTYMIAIGDLPGGPTAANHIQNAADSTNIYTLAAGTDTINFKVNGVADAITVLANGGVRFHPGAQAVGIQAHAQGNATAAVGDYSHAEGLRASTTGLYSHAEGRDTAANGFYSHAEGDATITIGTYSHAEGVNTAANGIASHSEGNSTTGAGNYSHAEGRTTTATGDYSHAEGLTTTATGLYSHAEGNATGTTGLYSHAEGRGTTTVGQASHAEGYLTTTNGLRSHAEGFTTTSTGDYSHAEGRGTTALGAYAHAAGYNATAGHDYSFCFSGELAGATTTAAGEFHVKSPASIVLDGLNVTMPSLIVAAAATNADALAAGVPIGGLYTVSANPGIVYIRNAL